MFSDTWGNESCPLPDPLCSLTPPRELLRETEVMGLACDIYNTKENMRQGELFLVSVNSYPAKICMNHQGKRGNTKGSREEWKG